MWSSFCIPCRHYWCFAVADLREVLKTYITKSVNFHIGKETLSSVTNPALLGLPIKHKRHKFVNKYGFHFYQHAKQNKTPQKTLSISVPLLGLHELYTRRDVTQTNNLSTKTIVYHLIHKTHITTQKMTRFFVALALQKCHFINRFIFGHIFSSSLFCFEQSFIND